jgi:hypothetical protein
MYNLGYCILTLQYWCTRVLACTHTLLLQVIGAGDDAEESHSVVDYTSVPRHAADDSASLLSDDDSVHNHSSSANGDNDIKSKAPAAATAHVHSSTVHRDVDSSGGDIELQPLASSSSNNHSTASRTSSKHRMDL